VISSHHEVDLEEAVLKGAVELVDFVERGGVRLAFGAGSVLEGEQEAAQQNENDDEGAD